MRRFQPLAIAPGSGRRGEEIGGVVVIESDSLIAARMNTLASRLDHGFTFAGGHALDAEQTALVPQHAIGRMLTEAPVPQLSLDSPC
jgi:hypothetical protein